MTRRFADFSKPRRPPYTICDWLMLVFGCLFAIAAFFVLTILLLAMAKPVHARDGGQWEKQDPFVSAWFKSLMQPDQPAISCCGFADAYYADKVETGKDGELVAVITDDRPDEPLGRHHVPIGTRVIVPPYKIKWDKGNPTGHIVIFLSFNNDVYCFVQAGGV
jgi:hypothetical protein